MEVVIGFDVDQPSAVGSVGGSGGGHVGIGMRLLLLLRVPVLVVYITDRHRWPAVGDGGVRLPVGGGS